MDMTPGMDTSDNVLAVLLALTPFLLLGAFIAYARTAYKEGGWKNVRHALWIAAGALAVMIVEGLIKHALLGEPN